MLAEVNTAQAPKRNHGKCHCEEREKQRVRYACGKVSNADQRAFDDGNQNRPVDCPTNGVDHPAGESLPWITKQTIGGIKNAVRYPRTVFEKTKQSNDPSGHQQGRC